MITREITSSHDTTMFHGFLFTWPLVLFGIAIVFGIVFFLGIICQIIYRQKKSDNNLPSTMQSSNTRSKQTVQISSDLFK